MPLFGSALWGGGAAGQAIQTGVPIKKLFYAALRLAHVTKFADASYQAPSPDQLGDCLLQAQLMISQANVRRAMCFTILITDYVLGTAEAYTLGPGGTLVSTTGTSVRPVKIEEARIILASSGTPVYLKVWNGSYQDFAALSVQQIPGAIPRFIYCDYANPVAKIYLVPQDQGGDTLELYTWSPVPSPVTVNDLISYAEGYDDWLVNNLAIRLASVFEERGAFVTDDTRMEARKATQALQSRNSAGPRQTNDAPGRSSGRGRGAGFNYFDGMPT